MKPATVSVRIDRSREDVFSFLDALVNHPQFTDHMLVDWTVDGPAAGLGAKARLRANVPGNQWMEMEVVESVPPVQTVEETIGAHGKRRTRGTTPSTSGPTVPLTSNPNSTISRRRCLRGWPRR